jgi:hypothetical protein
MSLHTDLSQIKCIALVRLAPGDAGYGVAWTREDGEICSERVGTRAQAEAVLQDLGARQQAPRQMASLPEKIAEIADTFADELLPFGKDIAAS